MLIELTALSAPDDPRLADYTSMTDVNLRKSLEVERGLYMAESTNVIIRALEAGHRPRSLMMAPRWLPDLEPLLEHFLGAADGGDTPVFIAPEELLESITGFHLHRGALAAMQRPELQAVTELLSSLGEGPKPGRSYERRRGFPKRCCFGRRCRARHAAVCRSFVQALSTSIHGDRVSSSMDQTRQVAGKR